LRDIIIRRKIYYNQVTIKIGYKKTHNTLFFSSIIIQNEYTKGS